MEGSVASCGVVHIVHGCCGLLEHCLDLWRLVDVVGGCAFWLLSAINQSCRPGFCLVEGDGGQEQVFRGIW